MAGLFAYSIYDLVKLHQDGSVRIEQQSGDDKKQRTYAVANCPTIPRIKFVICVSDAYAAYDEARRSREDLQAQQDSARAAFWVFIVSGAQALLGIIGIYFVARTLGLNARATGLATTATRAALRSASAAEKAYLADNRPWLNLTLDRVERYTPGKPVEVYVYLENLGKTPALDTKVWVKAVKVRMIQIDKSHVRKHVAECLRAAPVNTFQSAAVLPTVKMMTRQDAYPVEELESPNMNSTGYWLGILCVCTYRSAVTDKPERFFHSTLTLLLKPDVNKGFSGSIADDFAGTIAREAMSTEIITHVASIE